MELDGTLQRMVANLLQQFPDLAKEDRTRSDADPFVIALALANNVPVVTYEAAKPTKRRTPDVCHKMNVGWYLISAPTSS